MSRPKSFLIILSAKGGGDIPPVVALACGLRDRGHRVTVLRDEQTETLISSAELPSTTFAPELDHRGQITRWIGKLRETENGSDFEAPNPMVEWATPLVPFSQDAFSVVEPDLIVSTLFGIGLANELSMNSGRPWCFVNPSFYFGDHAARDWGEDWHGLSDGECTGIALLAASDGHAVVVRDHPGTCLDVARIHLVNGGGDVCPR